MATHNNRGFTLIELLVVISIIGMLASVILVALNGSRNKAKTARIQEETTQIRNSLETTRNSDGTYSSAYLTINPDGSDSTCNTYTGELPAGTNAYSVALDIIAQNGGTMAQAGLDLVSTPTNLGFMITTNAMAGTTYCSDPIPKSKPTQYAIFAALPGTVNANTSSSGYYCVDSSGKTSTSVTPVDWSGPPAQLPGTCP